MVEAYTPESLPPVTEVQVVALDGVWPDRVSDLGRAADEGRCVRVRSDAAERLAALWRRLPPGRQARCHVPPYGLRFLAGGREVCAASVCWRCNNIYGEAEGAPLHYEFDADDPVSRELLTALRRVTPAIEG